MLESCNPKWFQAEKFIYICGMTRAVRTKIMTDVRVNKKSLIDCQIEAHDLGYRSAHIARSLYGWGLRHISSLDNHTIIFEPIHPKVQEGFDYCLTDQYTLCLESALKWFEKDPANREVISSNYMLQQNWKGIDWKLLYEFIATRLESENND